jgi:hypothetical protein
MALRQWARVAVVCALAIPHAAAADPLLSGLRTGHPRLYFTPDEVTRVRELVKSDLHARGWYEKLVARSESMLDEEPVRLDPRSNSLLAQSRMALERISTLAGVYVIGGDQRFLDRAKRELLHLAGFDGWNPQRFLDVAEMTTALAIGYDWLHADLTAAERRLVSDAIIDHGLQSGIKSFESRSPPFWTKGVQSNWVQVCNAGLTIGALAVADEQPEIAARVMRYSRRAFKPAMEAYAPDGGFPEGPTYWRYATRYTAYHLGALETALGTDDGLLRSPGFDQTGYFRIHAIGPSAKSFNYADASDSTGVAAEMFYLAKVFQHYAYLQHEFNPADREPQIFHLIWYRPLSGEAATSRKDWQNVVPTDALFRGVNVAFFRSSWQKEQSLYVAVKGGDNKANHAHLDLGTFVLDWAGERFAVDLGPDDYSLPGYFGAKRWSYYRLRTESHNTITLDGQNQSLDGSAPVLAYHTAAERAHAVIDLTSGYRRQADRVMRGVAMIDRNRVLIQDEIEALRPSEITWNFTTPAALSVDGREALLILNKARLRLHLIEPRSASFEVFPAEAPRPQGKNPGINNIQVRLQNRVQYARIVVVAAPDGVEPQPGRTQPLATWQGRLRR